MCGRLPSDADAGDDEAATNAFEASENSWGSRIAGLADPAARAGRPDTS
jgi:hypothetical protein